MASSSFRDSINSLGWSRRDEPVNTSQQSGLLSSLQSLNPFQGGNGYVRLPTTESSGAPLPAPSRREEEEGWFVLSRWDRLLIFGACNLAAVACFVICFTLFPVLSLRPRKFVILFDMMVGRITNVPGLLRCRHGPDELRLSSSFYASTAIHYGILWLYCLDAGICLEAQFSLCSLPSFNLLALSGTWTGLS
ncbi:transport SFT2 [Fusarium beomiforme]|uniref:Transport SFT2 n=1 Tax=Fusarium beomiforme TaxID=44412 RepID=A0A9P5AHN9_9HYPO|nr:transport SFT2 [Fusarium beomiforme]